MSTTTTTAVAPEPRRGNRPTPDGPLTPDQRRDLVAAWLADPRNSAVGLLRHKRPDVYAAALAAGLCQGEIAAACHHALVRAARLYDPARGVALTTYLGTFLGGWVLRDVRAAARRCVAGSAPVAGADGVALLDTLADPNAADPAAFDGGAEAVRRTVRERLDPRTRLVVERRFGLGGGPPRLLQEIADELGLSKERVRQLVADATDRLRYALADFDPARC